MELFVGCLCLIFVGIVKSIDLESDPMVGVRVVKVNLDSDWI